MSFVGSGFRVQGSWVDLGSGLQGVKDLVSRGFGFSSYSSVGWAYWRQAQNSNKCMQTAAAGIMDRCLRFRVLCFRLQAITKRIEKV